MTKQITLMSDGQDVIADMGSGTLIAKNPQKYIQGMGTFLPADFGLLPAVTRFISGLDDHNQFYVVIEGRPHMRTISTYKKYEGKPDEPFLVPMPWHTWVFQFALREQTATMTSGRIYFHARQASSLEDYTTPGFLNACYLSNCFMEGSICWYPKLKTYKLGTDLDTWYKNIMNEFWGESFNSNALSTVQAYVNRNKVPITYQGYNNIIKSLLAWLSKKDLDFVLDEKFLVPVQGSVFPHIPMQNPVLSLDAMFKAMR